MSSSSSTVRSIADYLKHFFGKQFGLSQKITIRNGIVVRRQFQFALLSLSTGD